MSKEKSNQLAKRLIVVLSLTIVLLFGISKFRTSVDDSAIKGYSEFMTLVEEKKVENVQVFNTSIKYKLIGEEKTVKIGRVRDDNLVEFLYENGVDFGTEKDPLIDMSKIFTIIGIFLPSLLVYAIYMKILNGDSGKNIARAVQSNITFDDVAGQDEAKEQLKEIIDLLKNPDVYEKMGARLPKGVLLEGPPGTGKTLLAKAVAGEAHVPFYHVVGSSFIEKYAGTGAANVRALFNQAKQNAPAIIFIDEIDAIGLKRTGDGSAVSREEDKAVNELLAAMDGFSSDYPVVVLAATNRPGVLDPALLRTGRFDRKVIVGLPDLEGRKEIIKIHTDSIRLSPNVDLHELATVTAGASGSDLENMCNEAALIAVRSGKERVSHEDFVQAFEFTLLGSKKKNHILTPEERETVSIHEAGHAVVGSILKGSPTVQKITIVPRSSGALGYVMQTPKERQSLMTAEEIINEMVTLMAGRAAEEVFLGRITTGAQNDIEQATSIAIDYVGVYGMSSKLGPISLYDSPKTYLGGYHKERFGDFIMSVAENDIHSLLSRSYKIAVELVKEYKDIVQDVADILNEKETIVKKEFVEIMDKHLEGKTETYQIKLKEIKVDELMDFHPSTLEKQKPFINKDVVQSEREGRKVKENDKNIKKDIEEKPNNETKGDDEIVDKEEKEQSKESKTSIKNKHNEISIKKKEKEVEKESENEKVKEKAKENKKEEPSRPLFEDLVMQSEQEEIEEEEQLEEEISEWEDSMGFEEFGGDFDEDDFDEDDIEMPMPSGL